MRPVTVKAGRIVLELPEPPVQDNARGHYKARWRSKKETKKAAWRAAIVQVRPLNEPPRRVVVRAHFRLWGLRDEDGLTSSLKPVLDALKQAQPMRDKLDWRMAPEMPVAWLTRGYFFDDDPKHLSLEKPTQEINRKHRGLTLTIEPVA